MKKVFLMLLILPIIFLVSSCELFSLDDGQTTNNVSFKTVEYEPFTIDSFQTALQTAIEKSEQSVISITHEDGAFTISSTLGSAVVVAREAILRVPLLGEIEGNIVGYKYLAITNRHVIMYNNKISNRLKAYSFGETIRNAKCESYHTSVDAALISFETTIYIPVATIGDSVNLKKGSIVIAIGSPYDINYYASATMGIVSHPLRIVTDEKMNSTGTCNNQYIQHDASINPGNSGGGLFDINGNLIGINTSKITGSENAIEGMGFSIPINVMMDVFSDDINDWRN